MKKGVKLILIGGALMVPFSALNAEDSEAWKKELERKIDILTQEIEKFKMGGIAGDSMLAPVYEKARGFAPAASKVYHINRGVSIGGYGEMVYQDWSSTRDDGTASNSKSQLDFLRAVVYAGYKFTDKIHFNSEIEFEHASTSGGPGARGEVSLEFAYLDFMPWDHFGFRAGLLLVPVGLINELHEPTVFHGALRPSVEQHIIPTTWRDNGAGVFGETGSFRYRAYIVAGLQAVKDSTPGVGGFSASSGLRNGRSKGAKSVAEDFALAGRVDYEGIPGTLIGVSVYTGNSGQDALDAMGNEIDGTVGLWDVHGTAEVKGIELKGLYVKGAIDDVAALNAANGLTGSGSIGEELFGGYLEVAYDILPLFGCQQYLAPFVRWERLDTQQRVPTGFSKNPANDRTEYTYGMTYKPHPNTVIKLDFQNIDNKAGTGVDKFNAAVGYLF